MNTASFAFFICSFIFQAETLSMEGSHFDQRSGQLSTPVATMEFGSETSGNDLQLLKSGKEIYLQECKLCHGKDGKRGLFKASDLSQSKLTQEERIAWIKSGKGVMPAYEEKLTPNEIEAVATYLDELK